jgi:ATP-dependent helicase/nuclease subunit B
MAVQFVLGRSGTGKTSYCVKAIVDALRAPASEQSLIFLVPEQATYQAERAILGDSRIAGYNRLHVLSFDRLQFMLLGKNTARPTISRIGQQMIIHKILRQHADKLNIFGSSADRPGVSRQIAQTIIEMHQYAKTPENIERLLERLGKDESNGLAALKFADIGLILNEYLRSIEGKFIDPDVQLTRACRAVATADFTQGARVWVDGFAGFAAGELAILTELLKAASHAQIALCLDPSGTDLADPNTDKLDATGLFYPTQRTYLALIDIVRKCKLPLAAPVVLDKPARFAGCPQLARIESSMFSDTSEEPADPQPKNTNTAGRIHIVSAPNARAEAKYVAGRILHLVKDEGFRYRDIAVIASDIDSYEHYIRAYFDDYDVPFFIDKRKPLNQHPVVQLICSALQAVTGDFAGSDIFAYLKTDLAAMAHRDIDLLENYCVAFGVTGGDWQSSRPWQFAGDEDREFDEQRIDQIRRQAIKPLLKLRDSLCPGDRKPNLLDAADFTRCVFDLLDDLQVHETLGSWIEEAVEQDDYATADEHRQFYDKLVNVFDELADVFAGQRMSPQDYLAVINSTFSQLTLAFIPPTLDQVLVGSIERSRHPDLKAVFLIGTTQKQFPAPLTLDSILTQQDRSAAEAADFTLGASVGEQLAERRYLAYIAFTRPSEFLYVTYPAVDEKASAVPRSQFVTDLESLFEDLHEEQYTGEHGDISEVHNAAELADTLCTQLSGDALAPDRHNGDVAAGILDDIRADDRLGEIGGKVTHALNYDNRATLESDVAERFFGRRVSSSATRLSDFAKCPYKHFAEHTLALKERKEFKLEPLDLGVFYHRVLDGWLKRLRPQTRDFAAIEDSELLKALRDQINELMQTNAFISNFVRHSAHHAYLVDSASQNLEDCVLAIAEMVRAGDFRPVLSEVSFGDNDTTLGRYELALANGRVLSLNGKIDRLDIAETESGEFATVFDYKRRSKSFSWAELYHGLDMQLPVYMLAIRKGTGSKAKDVVGAFYMPVEVTPAKAAFDELSEKTAGFARKARGILNGEFFQQFDASSSNKFYNFFVTKKGDQYGYPNRSGALSPVDFDALLQFAEQKIAAIAGQIIAGKIDVTPYRLSGKSPCAYCKYQPVCRFDWQINDYNFLEPIDKPGLLERAGVVDE